MSTEEKRRCPRSHPATPHDMRRDSGGTWYCPLERDASREREALAASKPSSLVSSLRPNGEARDAAYDRIGQHDAERLNAVASAVETVLGFTPLDERYAIAVLALEALDLKSRDSRP